jgi:hypothetical protein
MSLSMTSRHLVIASSARINTRQMRKKYIFCLSKETPDHIIQPKDMKIWEKYSGSAKKRKQGEYILSFELIE